MYGVGRREHEEQIVMLGRPRDKRIAPPLGGLRRRGRRYPIVGRDAVLTDPVSNTEARW
jgi:hypothetical protein